MIYVKAFVVGGIICTLVQIFLDHTKLMPGRVMVLLVITGVILGAAGIYEPLIKWAGCGASVPLSGFGYNLSKEKQVITLIPVCRGFAFPCNDCAAGQINNSAYQKK